MAFIVTSMQLQNTAWLSFGIFKDKGMSVLVTSLLRGTEVTQVTEAEQVEKASVQKANLNYILFDDFIGEITILKFQHTCTRMSSKMLCLCPRAPFPTGYCVIERSCYKLLFIKLHCSTSVCLDAIYALTCAYIPQFCRQVI